MRIRYINNYFSEDRNLFIFHAAKSDNGRKYVDQKYCVIYKI